MALAIGRRHREVLVEECHIIVQLGGRRSRGAGLQRVHSGRLRVNGKAVAIAYCTMTKAARMHHMLPLVMQLQLAGELPAGSCERPLPTDGAST